MRLVGGEYKGTVLITYVRRGNNQRFKAWVVGHKFHITTMWIRWRQMQGQEQVGGINASNISRPGEITKGALLGK